MAETEEELKSLLMKVKEESEKAGLKLNFQKTNIMTSDPFTLWHPVPSLQGKKWEKKEILTDFMFLGSKITSNGNCSHEIKILASWKKRYDKPRQCIKKQRYHFANSQSYSQSYGFSSSHVWMWELDHKEDWAPKNWCFWTIVLKKTLESPLDSKEIKLVNPKGNQLWIFIGRTDAEAEAPILWPPDATSWLIEKDPDARKDWRQEENREAEDEMDGITDSVDLSLANFRRRWRTGKPGMLQCMELQRAGHDRATEQPRDVAILPLGLYATENHNLKRHLYSKEVRRVGFKHTQYHVWNRSSRSTYCKAQGTLLSL